MFSLFNFFKKKKVDRITHADHLCDYRIWIDNGPSAFIAALRLDVPKIKNDSLEKQEQLVKKQPNLLPLVLKMCVRHRNVDVWQSTIRLLVRCLKTRPLLILLDKGCLFVTAAQYGLPYFNALFSETLVLLRSCLEMDQEIIHDTRSRSDSLLITVMSACVQAGQDTHWPAILSALQTIHPQDDRIYRIHQSDFFYTVLQKEHSLRSKQDLFSFVASQVLRHDYYYVLLASLSTYYDVCLVQHNDPALLFAKQHNDAIRSHDMLFRLLDSHQRGNQCIFAWLAQQYRATKVRLYRDVSQCIAQYVLGPVKKQAGNWEKALSTLSSWLEADLFMKVLHHPNYGWLHQYVTQTKQYSGFAGALWRVTLAHESAASLMHKIFLSNKQLFLTCFQWCEEESKWGNWTGMISNFLSHHGQRMRQLLRNTRNAKECESLYVIPIYESLANDLLTNGKALTQFARLIPYSKLSLQYQEKVSSAIQEEIPNRY